MYYRVEDKYIIYDDQIAYLRNRLKDLMKRDAHSRDGAYLIRSVYFDDLHDSALMENLAGVDERSKFRIRTYDCDASFIRLEEKSKKSGYTHKESAVMSLDAAKGILLEGGGPLRVSKASRSLKAEEGYLFKKLYTVMNTRLLHPKTIVEYEREAFVESSGNVRITFDRNISASPQVDSFFKRNICGVPVLEKGAHVLEVKYDEFLPDYIKKIIDIGSLQRTAFSKYTYARGWREQSGECL